jgi:hypothetical protein
MIKKIVTIIYIIGAVAVVLLIVRLLIPTSQEKYIAKNCPQYHFSSGFVDRTDFIDCKNYIGIEKYVGENVLTVFNGLFPKSGNWDSFQINNYKISGNNIYYIEDPELNNNSTYYSATEWPSTTTTPSIFRVIDSQTSNITLYKTLGEVPEDEQPIFQELQK